jgi:hypothetical protein
MNKLKISKIIIVLSCLMFLYSPTSFANDLEKDVYNAYTKKIENMELDKQISVSK